MQEIIEKFNKENEKGIEVVGEEVPWDGGADPENLFNACMGGGSPDVATWKLTSTPLFVNNDLLTDLTPYIDKWEDKDDIPENIYNIMKEAGGSEEEMYVMPWNVQVYMFKTIDHLFLKKQEWKYRKLTMNFWKQLKNVRWIQMGTERQMFMDSE